MTMSSYRELLRDQLIIDEGDRNFPYDDKTGDTVVAGSIILGNVTIGIGHNLSGIGVRPDEKTLMYTNDVNEAESAARRLIPEFDQLSDGRKMVVVNMAFNMGYDTFSQFRNTIGAIREGRWADAKRGMLNSTWARQTKGRAIRLANIMGGTVI